MLAGCFIFLDFATLVTAVMVLVLAGRGWRAIRPGGWIVVLTQLCLLGALIVTLLAATGNGDNHVHPVSVLLWGSGVVLSAVIYYASGPRAWWSRTDSGRPHPAAAIVSGDTHGR